MANSWIQALKKWNQGKSTYCVPKKGTQQYEEVRKLMGTSAPAKKAPAKRNIPNVPSEYILKPTQSAPIKAAVKTPTVSNKKGATFTIDLNKHPKDVQKSLNRKPVADKIMVYEAYIAALGPKTKKKSESRQQYSTRRWNISLYEGYLTKYKK